MVELYGNSYNISFEVPWLFSFNGINYQTYDLLFHRILINRCCARSCEKIEFHIGTACELELPPKPLKFIL